VATNEFYLLVLNFLKIFQIVLQLNQLNLQIVYKNLTSLLIGDGRARP